jgi:hypothetical protein
LRQPITIAMTSLAGALEMTYRLVGHAGRASSLFFVLLCAISFQELIEGDENGRTERVG